MFEPDVYVERRSRLAEAIDGGVVLLLGNDLAPMNYPDNPYPFRQDSTFLYYIGLDAPGLAAVLDVDSGETIVFGHDPTLEEIVWSGPVPSLAQECGRVGVEHVRQPEELGAWLEARAGAGRTIHFLPQYRAENRLKLQALLAISALETELHVSRPLVEAVVEQRLRKTEAELAEIELALDVSYEMHTLAMRLTRPGTVEREVAGAVEGVVRSHGGLLAFPVIFSVRGEVLHNHSYENLMSEGQLVVHDSGATSPLGYASDITRTIPVGGRFTDPQAEVYRIVLDAQLAAIEAMRPGIPFRDVHLLACRRLADGLAELGILRGDLDAAVAAGAHALCMPHGLGHMMGLDVHDMEGLDEDLVGYGKEFRRSDQFGLNFLRVARTLEPGFVLTVEPGLYFIPPLIDRWREEGRHEEYIDYARLEEFRGFGGIRIEDDVVVTSDGHRVLGRPIPKAIEEVEEAMGGA